MWSFIMRYGIIILFIGSFISLRKSPPFLVCCEFLSRMDVRLCQTLPASIEVILWVFSPLLSAGNVTLIDLRM